jgi:peptidoglycan biosynthesis protein MviN/MurJ (putative lipid II flippase)
MVGLMGYSGFYLLTRASYAIDDVRSPTMVYLWATIGAIVGMAVASSLSENSGKVVVLGLVQGAAVTLGSLGLYARLRKRTGRPMPVTAAILRAGLGTAVGAGAAWWVVSRIGWSTDPRALESVVAAGVVGVVVYAMVLVALRTPELDPVWAKARSVAGRAAR